MKIKQRADVENVDIADGVKNALIDGVKICFRDGECSEVCLLLSFSYGIAHQGLLLPLDYFIGGGVDFLCESTVTLLLRHIMRVVGVDSLFDIKGKYCRVYATQSAVKMIGHLTKNEWVEFSDYFEKGKGE